jgi:hypothetical protein
MPTRNSAGMGGRRQSCRLLTWPAALLSKCHCELKRILVLCITTHSIDPHLNNPASTSPVPSVRGWTAKSGAASASTLEGCRGFFFGALYITSRKLSKGLVTAPSCRGLTSSGIGQCSCCTSPNGRTKKACFLAPTEIVGASLFNQTRHGKL